MHRHPINHSTSHNAMNSSDTINLGPLPDLFPELNHDLKFCATPLEDLVPDPSELLKQPNIAASVTRTNKFVPSPTGVHAAPEVFPGLNVEKTANQKRVSLASVTKNSNFKTSLKSVLSRPDSIATHSSAITLSRRHPDRNCDIELTRKHPDRICDAPQARKHLDQNCDIVRTLSQKSLRANSQLPKRESTQGISQKSTISLRKVRSSSCSKLPRRKSQEIATKRPCDLADKAIANGTPLSKEQARAIRNRQHAMASRLRAKQKRQHLEAENVALKNRVKTLEEEQQRLINERDALRLQQGLDLGLG